MTPTPEFNSASSLISVEHLAKQVMSAYQSFSRDNLDDVDLLYTTDVYFEDPSHAMQGKEALLDYFANVFANLEDCSFKFHQTISNSTDIFMSWTMFVNHPKLKSGETIRVEGASYLKTRNGKIYYQRDYFDMGAMVYEHLPLIGRILNNVKQRLGQ
ncbi:uncharacterized protein METZ01_LOCUS393083 [marine metagenome]|uniref:SnoaL-like domain-containing protein n=1 Tax=marine metagenome TaxID=408172 RepID=A0A382V187_9ZZZZ